MLILIAAAFIALALSACGSSSSGSPSAPASSSAPATPAEQVQQTPQQELASAVEQTTTANGATVDSATVGTMQTWIPGTGTQVDISQWSQPGNDTYAQGEVFLSDGNQYSVNISVDRQGIVIWSVQN